MSPKAPMVRALLTVWIVAASVAFAACGDDEDAGGPAANAGTGSGLGTERFKALDALYVAQVPIDEIDEDAPLSAMDTVLEDYEETCIKLDRDDELLAAYRRVCPLVADIRQQLAGVDACEDDTGVQPCVDALSGFRRVAREYIRHGRRYDALVKRAKLTPACEKALVNPERAYEVMGGYGRAFGYLERALTTTSEEALRKAGALLKQVESRAEDAPDAKQLLQDFRSGCA